MKRLLAISGLVLAVGPVPGTLARSHAAPRVQPPNIILVTLDDPNPSHLGLAGYPIGVTPRIDSLQSQGCVFRNALTSPRCAPAVAQLMSGRECPLNGICWNDGNGTPPANLLPTVLEGLGYETFAQGKGAVAGPAGTAISDPLLWRDSAQPAWTNPMATFAGGGGSSPRFMWVMPIMPHVPWNPAIYSTDPIEGIPVPEEVVDEPGFLVAEEEQIRMTQYTDIRFGQFMTGLRSAFEANSKKTLVILVVGDNAYTNGRIGKGSPYEAGVRTWISFTHLDSTTTTPVFIDVPISTIDVSKTILKLAGASEGECDGLGYRGEDLTPLLMGQAEADWIASVGRDTVYGAAFPGSRGINVLPSGYTYRTPEEDVYALYGHHMDGDGSRWKYVVWEKEVIEGDAPDPNDPLSVGTNDVALHHAFAGFGSRAPLTEELYLLEDRVGPDSDPEERTNVATTYPDKLVQLRNGAYQWWSDLGGGDIPRLWEPAGN